MASPAQVTYPETYRRDGRRIWAQALRPSLHLRDGFILGGKFIRARKNRRAAQRRKRRYHAEHGDERNALKHGFYSRYFKANEIEAIQSLPDDDLGQEIAALRVIIRRILQVQLASTTSTPACGSVSWRGKASGCSWSGGGRAVMDLPLAPALKGWIDRGHR